MNYAQTNEIKTHLPETFESNSKFITSQYRAAQWCTSCGKEMEFVEGDVIYGENWYHQKCWVIAKQYGSQPIQQSKSVTRREENGRKLEFYYSAMI